MAVAIGNGTFDGGEKPAVTSDVYFSEISPSGLTARGPVAIVVNISIPTGIPFAVIDVTFGYAPGLGTIVGAGPGIGTPGINAGPLFSTPFTPNANATTLQGFGWTAGAQGPPFAGFQFAGSGDQVLWGPTAGTPLSISISFGYNLLMPELIPAP